MHMRAGIKVCLFATTLLLTITTQALALYTPNPAARWDAGHFFLAGDLQWNGDKDLEHGEIDDEIGLYVRPAYTFAPNMVAYGRVGFQDADSTDTGFAIGAGLQMAWELPQATDWAIGGSIDYLFWDLDNVDYHEIQLAPAVSYNIPQVREITPYAGLAFDFLVDDLEEDDPVGLLFGSNFDVDRWRFDAQFRVINESGLMVSAGYMF
jgi:opacity protein-like surface antigen